MDNAFISISKMWLKAINGMMLYKLIDVNHSIKHKLKRKSCLEISKTKIFSFLKQQIKTRQFMTINAKLGRIYRI